MATLDVSDVLDDPDFWSDFALVRAPSGIGSGGVTVTLPVEALLRGVVIADGGRDLVQDGTGDAVQADITVYTRVALTVGDRATAADVVVWRGNPYRVIQAQPWDYGAGYTRALCKLTTINSSDVDHGVGGFLG